MQRELIAIFRCLFKCAYLSAFSILCLTGNSLPDELSYAGLQSKDVSVKGNSASSGSQSVSLYTGQHVETFSLASIPTNGLGRIDIELSYSGNVFQAATEENRRIPASWVGLGFEMGQEYILCDHKGTVTLADDEYFFVAGSGGSVKLIRQLTTNVFLPSSGDKWRFERNVVIIGGEQFVNGWTLKKQNGLVFTFGDFSADFINGRNATWYLMSWGEFVLVGAGTGDMPFPIRWDLAQANRGANNWVTYEYDQVDVKLTIDAPPSNLTDNFYTQASYLQKITSSTGHAVEFILENRTDFQPYFNSSQYDYYRSKRLTKLQITYKNAITSSTVLSYDYLNGGADPRWQKSLLTSIRTFEKSDIQSLPPIEFQYFTNNLSPFFGAIKEITYSLGSKKEIVYDIISPDSMLVNLNQGGYIPYAERPRYAHSSTTMIRKYRLTGQLEWHYDVGAFNGYWDMRELSDITDSNGDSSITAGEGWVAFYNHDLNKFIVLSFNGGQWTRDTIDPEWNTLDHSMSVSAAPGAGEQSSSYTATADGFVEYHLELYSSGSGGGQQTNESGPNSEAYIKIDGVIIERVTDDETASGTVSVSVGQVVQVVAIAKPEDSGPAIAEANIYAPEIPNQEVMLKAGNDFFVALDVKNAAPMKLVKKGFMFKKTSTGWQEHFLFNQGHYNDSLKSIKLGLDSYAIQIEDSFDQNKSKLVFGKYLKETNSVVSQASPWIDQMIFDVSIDLVTYGMSLDYEIQCNGFLNDYVYIWEFKESQWSDTAVIASGLRDLIALEHGVVFVEGWFGFPNLCEFIGAVESGHLFYYIRNEAGWHNGSFDIGYDAANPVLDPLASSGGMSFSLHRDRIGLSNTQDDIYIYEWNGTGWNSTAAVTDVWNDMTMILSDETFLAYHLPENSSNLNGQLYAKKRTGAGQWSSTVLLNSQVFNSYYQACCGWVSFGPAHLRVAGDMIIACGEPGIWGTITRDLYRWDQESNSWGTTSLIPYTFDPTIATSFYAHPYLFNGRFFISDFEKVPPYIQRGLYSFQVYQDQIIGKPEIPVVVQVKSFAEGDATVDPILLDFSYAGGVLDPAGNMPRFCRSTKSTPYFLSEATPDGYSIRYFYNDLDDDFLQDPYGDGSLLIPDLNASWFNAPNGGYLLDGQIYLKYDSTVSATAPSMPHNTDFFYHSLQVATSSPDKRYRVIVDSVKSRVEGVETVHRTFYDSDGRIVEQHNLLYDNMTKIVEINYQNFTTSQNVYDRVSMRSERIETPAVTQWISRTQSFWSYEAGDVRLTKSVVWPDASNSLLDGSEIVTFDLISSLPESGYDSYGNLTCWTKTASDTVCGKFSADGAFNVAGASNCFVDELLVQDFEQPDLWDGWAYNDFRPGVTVVTSEKFTGEKCIKIVDLNPGDALKSWGPSRDIPINSLTDTLYYVSAWVKANHKAHIYVWVMEAGNSPPLLYHVLPFEAPQPVLNVDWVKVEGVFTIPKVVINASGSHQVDHVSIVFAAIDAPFDTNYVYIDNFRFHPSDAQVITATYGTEDGLVTSQSGFDNVSARQEYDIFGRESVIKDFRGNVLQETDYYFSRSAASGTYDPVNPNYIKTTVYRTGQTPIAQVRFSDGNGRTLQTRATTEYDGQPGIFVGGVATYNAKGQQLKAYKPYVDVIAPSSVGDFMPIAQYEIQLNNFYDGSPEADMKFLPFKEQGFEAGVKARLLEQSEAGIDFSLGGVKTITTSYSQNVVGADTILVVTSNDQDGIITEAHTHARGKYASTVVHYTNKDGLPATTSNTSYGLPMQQQSYATIDTGNGEIEMRRSFFNDRGLVDSTWKVDRGTIRVLYDKSGRKRFMQDSLHLLSDGFVYYKYDSQGRKIEEGTLTGAIGQFTQANANNGVFPDIGVSADVKYRWYYDYYYSITPINPFDANNPNEIINPGNLVRLESGDGTYYQNYFLYPDERWDCTITMLPITGGSEKAIKRYYRIDGSMSRKEVYPAFPSVTGMRAFEYENDQGGRLKSINEGSPFRGFPLLYDRKYAEYDYTANGSPKVVNYGRYDRAFPDSHSIVQKVDYLYDTRGMLLKINEPSLPSGSGGVINSLFGGVTDQTDNDHFGLSLKYFDLTGGYYNGRVWGTNSVNSKSETQSTVHTYTYNYNELNWLTAADHDQQISTDRKYSYNALGARDSMEVGNNDSYSTKYYYDTGGNPGSSKLLRTNLMGSSPDIHYDAVGNMISDSSRILYEQKYDYRNQLTYSNIDKVTSNLYVSHLWFTYDESGNRIKKKFVYSYWGTCEDPDIILSASSFSVSTSTVNSASAGPGGPGGIPCPKSMTVETFYLYDNGKLIATFDQNDNVIDLYVNGPEGKIASYLNNDQASLHYFLKDHIGSVRVVIHDRENDVPVVVQTNNYYPYGVVLDSWGSSPNMMKFSGKEQDLHTSFNFDYFGARYYDAFHGRFTTLDRARQYANGYSYVGNNPISIIDPNGNAGFVAYFFYALIAYNSYQQFEYLVLGEGPFVYRFAAVFQTTVENLIVSKAANFYSKKVGGFLHSETAEWATRSAVHSGYNAYFKGDDFSINFAVGEYNFSRGSWGWNDFSGDFYSDVATVQGWAAFSADYAKVMPHIDKFVIDLIFGERKVNTSEGDISEEELSVKPGEEDGKTNFVEIMGPGETKGENGRNRDMTSINPWPWYRHVNPLDMITHLLSELFTNTFQKGSHRRGLGGLHEIMDYTKETGYQHTLHVDRYSPIYGVNFINHLIFESEVLKATYKDDYRKFGSPETQSARARMSRELRTLYNATTNIHWRR